MNTICRFAILATAVMLASLVTRPAPAQEQPPQLDPAELEKLFKDFAKLAPQHELLKEKVGQWKTESKTYYANPNEPDVSTGKASFKLIMGGRYLQQLYEGKFDGETFQGLGLTGFDKSQNKYVAIWVDNMGSGIAHSVGEYDEKTKTLTEISVSNSPIGEMKSKLVTQTVSDDQFLFTMYMLTPDGAESKAMEIMYTRME